MTGPPCPRSGEGVGDRAGVGAAHGEQRRAEGVTEEGDGTLTFVNPAHDHLVPRAICGHSMTVTARQPCRPLF